jgi:hypothetical protein
MCRDLATHRAAFAAPVSGSFIFGKVYVIGLAPSRMQTPLQGPYHQQSCRPQAIHEMVGADASKGHIGVPGQSSRIENRLTQNARNLGIGKLLVGRSEQHERDHSGIAG